MRSPIRSGPSFISAASALIIISRLRVVGTYLLRHWVTERLVTQVKGGFFRNSAETARAQNKLANASLSCSRYAKNNRDPALDFEGSEMLTIRRDSEAEGGGTGWPTQMRRHWRD